MKLNLFILPILLSYNLFSQNDKKTLDNYKLNNEYTVIMNGDLSSMEHLEYITKTLKQESIEETIIYEPNDQQNVHLKKIPNLCKNGVFELKVKNEILKTSQEQLNTHHKINPNNNIYYNGYLIENKSYKICTDAIFEIEIDSTSITKSSSNKVINVWTVNKSKRFRTASTYNCHRNQNCKPITQ